MPEIEQAMPAACSYPGCVLHRDHSGDHEYEDFHPDDPTTGQVADEPTPNDPEVGRR